MANTKQKQWYFYRFFFFNHTALSGLFVCLFVSITDLLIIHNSFWFCFYGFLCIGLCVPLCLCVSSVFLLAHFIFFFVCFLFWFVCFYIISFYYHFKCLFIFWWESKKDYRFGRQGRSERSWGRGNSNHSTLSRKYTFNKKGRYVERQKWNLMWHLSCLVIV